jgi:hypothetical protein
MRKQTLIYDISSCPDNAGLSLEKIMQLYMQHNVVFYDSFKEDGSKVDKPQLVNVPEETEFKIVDLSEDEGARELLEKLNSDDT